MPSDTPLLGKDASVSHLNDRIAGNALSRPGRGWLFGFAVSFALLILLQFCVVWLFTKGVGIWGIQIPVAWGFAIINFVWWIGIGHAGTFISAILLLLHQDWRTSINRFTEAMTLFAVACAGLFPLLHLGRPQYFYWLIPYPDTMNLWPQFRSPLVWDFFAVSTYATVSLLFWFLGLVPDLATLRDTAKPRWKQRLYGIFALGWRNSARHWEHYKRVYLVLATLAAPLVISVHSIVGLDFAYANLPGWHSTIFPPYFVAGAIYSGFAMVLTLCIPLRRFHRLHDYITDAHLDKMAKVLLLTGLIVCYGYLSEMFMAWYSGETIERYMAANRLGGAAAVSFWALIVCNCLSPQFLWFRKVRQSPFILFILSLVINLGMWLERYVIVVTSLERDFLPSSWQGFKPTFWDYATLAGTFGLFFTLLFLFVRSLPVISMSEMREFIHEKKKEDAS
ncbi:NrfD/PsrC family molybdoenzyme membrane anchor subunit [Haloferula sargassicola]|uniref:Hydrogenase n=1 Tax=Haloferula sargassicola TaxID=490096 RepID=A0ABP9ULE8_9BACT